MVEMPCATCALRGDESIMEEVPVWFLEEKEMLTEEFIEPLVLTAILHCQKQGEPVQVFLCPPPPYGDGCGAQAALAGTEKDDFVLQLPDSTSWSVTRAGLQDLKEEE